MITARGGRKSILRKMVTLLSYASCILIAALALNFAYEVWRSQITDVAGLECKQGLVTIDGELAEPEEAFYLYIIMQAVRKNESQIKHILHFNDDQPEPEVLWTIDNTDNEFHETPDSLLFVRNEDGKSLFRLGVNRKTLSLFWVEHTPPKYYTILRASNVHSKWAGIDGDIDPLILSDNPFVRMFDKDTVVTELYGCRTVKPSLLRRISTEKYDNRVRDNQL